MDHKLFIGGRWADAVSGRTYSIVNPATEEQLGVAPQAGAEDVAAAIQAARSGFDIWRKTSAWDRASMLRRISGLIYEARDEIARNITEEIGKPIAQSQAEVQMAFELFDWFADEARRIFGQVIQTRNPAERNIVVLEPVGIVAGISPWNFPVLAMARKIAPALAAGCAVISRPASEAPGAVLLLARCCIDAGLPAGVLNILTGSASEIVPTLMQEPAVRKVSFTGSIEIGQLLMRQAADTVKKLTMELGGHAPVMIFPDVDIPAVARLSVAGKFRNAGQVCASPTRFFVHNSQIDEFAEHFSGHARALKLGNGIDPSVEMGPMTSARRLASFDELIVDAVKAGAELRTGGRRPEHLNRGYFYEPTLLVNVPDNARIMSEEPFGPVAIVNGFDDLDEAFAKANSLDVALCAYAFTSSLENSHLAADRLQAGVVAINSFAASRAETPFGGNKMSGFGREGGTFTMQDYLTAKYVNLTTRLA